MSFDYQIVASQMMENGACVAVETKDKPGLVFSFAEIREEQDENGNTYVNYVCSILGKRDLEDDDLVKYSESLFIHVFTENTDLNSEDLIPSTAL